MNMKGALVLALATCALAAAVSARGRTNNGPIDVLKQDYRKHGWPLRLSASTVPPTSTPGTPKYHNKVEITTTISVPPASFSPPNVNSTTSVTAASALPTGTEDGEVATTPEENEAEYLAPVSIGGQLLNLNFDTGSADFWVFSSALSKGQIGGHSYYDPDKSATWQPSAGATWDITYGDGSSASGLVGYDVVDIGGATVEKQCVEIATYVSGEMIEDPNSDGLVGLAFNSLINTVLPTRQKTFFENVMYDLSEPLFTADLEETTGKGTYKFGSIDHTKYRGEIHYAPVIDEESGFWYIETPSFKLGNETTLYCEACAAIVDTGSSLLYLEAGLVAEYYSHIPGSSDNTQNFWSVPCNANIPPMSIEIGTGTGWYATIKGEDMLFFRDPEKDNVCWGGLQVSPNGFQILGDVFLKQFFAVFDGGNKRVGIAEKD